MNVQLTPLAIRDLDHALDYYARVQGALADRFLSELENVIERLQMFPAGAPPVEGFDDLRRARMRSFPYGVFYQYTPAEDALVIVRVLHSRRGAPDASAVDR